MRSIASELRNCIVCEWQGFQVPAAVTCGTCGAKLCPEHGELHEELFDTKIDWRRP